MKLNTNFIKSNMQLLRNNIERSHVVMFTIVAIPLSMYLYFKLKPKKEKHPIVKEWKSDMVYLCQFPCSPKMRTISPFALKLETWLRLTGIQYTNVYTTTFSKSTKMIPFIELNGQEYADTSVIIEKFKQMFQVDPDEVLTTEQRALGHTIKRMAECHTIKYAFYWRYGTMMPIFFEQALNQWEKTRTVTFFKKLQPTISKVRAYFNGISRLSRSEQVEQCRQDFEVLSVFLGEKDYFLGTEHPTTIDCAMFGILVQFLCLPNVDMCPDLENSINNSYKNLRHFMQRMKDKLWPDWDEMCLSMGSKTGIEGKPFGVKTLKSSS